MKMLFLLLSSIFFSLSAHEAKQQECRFPAPQWNQLSSLEIKNIKLAILPVGSTESHGPHLPLGTDSLLSERLVKHATDGLNDLAILPSTSYGASYEHSSRPGTISLNDNTLHSLWGEIIDGVVSSGINKLLIVNGHGGQTPNAQIAVRTARFRLDALAILFDVQASLAESFLSLELSLDDELRRREAKYGIHGGLVETAVMSFLFPSYVNMEAADNFVAEWPSKSPLQPYGRVASFGWKSEDICLHGAVGNAAAANTEIGHMIFNASVAQLRDVIVKILNTSRDDALSVQKRSYT